MADERLRELERRWRETGAPGDEAAFLLERVRAGTLAREKLELAAWCGHAAALLATDLEPAPPQQMLTAWAGDLVKWTDDRTAMSIARAAAGRALLGVPDAAQEAESFLALIDEWLATSSPELPREAARRYEVLERHPETPRAHVTSAAGTAALLVVRAAGRSDIGRPGWGGTAGVNIDKRTVVQAVVGHAVRALTEPDRTSASRAAALIREAISAAVVKEALAGG